MKHTILFLLLLLAACRSEDTATGFATNISKVNPFIGTDGKGKTYPGATLPFGMVQLSPDNGHGGWDWISGYFYPDSLIAGFSHTHLSGTGIGDLYDISFMPFTEPPYQEDLDGDTTQLEICARFSHQKEAASPGYYEVRLQDYGIDVSLTASTRCGLQRYSFPAGKHAMVKLDLGYSRNWDATKKAFLQIHNDSTISGYRYSSGWAKDQRVYFFTQFSHPFTFTNQAEQADKKNNWEGTDVEIVLEFGDLSSRPLLVKTGISSVSTHNARNNLEKEMPQWGFEGVRKAAASVWQEQLNKISFQSTIPGVEEVFYTALYQSMLAPTTFQDVNGEYKGADALGSTQSTPHQRYTMDLQEKSRQIIRG